MKLLLDEMWSRAIAEQLRARGIDAVAATEADRARRYRRIADDELFARAQADGRTVVTDNVEDFLPLCAEYDARTLPHHGVILALAPQFNRHDGGAVGAMVRALEAFVRSAPAEPLGRVHFLRRV